MNGGRIMKKHFWTILLVLCMALCLIPTPEVYASDFNGWTKLTDEYSGKKLESGNYYLDSDVTLSDMITILENKTVTIDLNGHVLKKAGGTLLFWKREVRFIMEMISAILLEQN